MYSTLHIKYICLCSWWHFDACYNKRSQELAWYTSCPNTLQQAPRSARWLLPYYGHGLSTFRRSKCKNHDATQERTTHFGRHNTWILPYIDFHQTSRWMGYAFAIRWVCILQNTITSLRKWILTECLWVVLLITSIACMKGRYNPDWDYIYHGLGRFWL